MTFEEVNPKIIDYYLKKNCKMTKKEKTDILTFIIYIHGYIHSESESNIISFIHGYELGRDNKCDFTELIKKHLEVNLSIPSSSDGWSGQIKRYSNKKLISWSKAFKQIGLEVIASKDSGGLDDKMKEIIKKRVLVLIKRINENGDIYFGREWSEEWNCIVPFKSEWFKNMWLDNEFKIIKDISLVIIKKIEFEESIPFRPSNKLLSLKYKFDLESKNNEVLKK